MHWLQEFSATLQPKVIKCCDNMKDRQTKKASITVYLSLILLILISIMAQVMQEAMFQADRMKVFSAMDISLNAVLSEYCTELVEQYGVFFVDNSNETIASRLDYYMYKNIQEQSGMLQMQLIDTEITKVMLATDDNGTVFLKEAIKAYQERIAAETIEKALEQSKKYKEAEKSRKTIEENQVEPADLEIPQDIEVDKEEKEKAEKVVNPVEVINALKANGLLAIVAGDLDISSNSIDLNTTLQKRTLQKGNVQEKENVSVLEKMVFDLYIKDQFSSFGNEKKKDGVSGLKYEIEYMIAGKGGDKENLTGVLEKILWIREGINFAYLLTDKVKLAEAEALATALVGYTGIMPLITAMKFAILAVWAYGESLLEVRILLTGGKVNFEKTKENWKLELSELVNISQIVKGKSKDDERGLSYEEYLWILLTASSTESKCYRSMDLIEKRIQSVTNVASFRMDLCVAYMEGKVLAVSRSGREIVVLKAIKYG